MRAEVIRAVRERAGERCEYCRMHQMLQGATFHIEHVVPRARGGPDDPDNLALACPRCNLHKSDRVEVPAPDSAGKVRLFNPRSDVWDDHFGWDGYRVVAKSDVGAGMLFAFDLNHPRRLLIREAEEMYGLYPPR